MSLTITIQTERSPDLKLSPAQQVEESLAAIGFVRMPTRLSAELASTTALAPESRSELSVLSVYEDETTAGCNISAPPEEVKATPAEPKRRGRSKAEPAKAEPAQQTDIEDAIAKASPAEPERQISTGEERTAPEDTPEDEVQDMHDEIAETAAAAGPPATIEDLRRVMGGYVNKYGMPATQSDGLNIFTSVLGPVPEGMKKADGSPATAWQAPLVPENRIGDAIAAWQQAIDSNPFDRAPVNASKAA